MGYSSRKSMSGRRCGRKSLSASSSMIMRICSMRKGGAEMPFFFFPLAISSRRTAASNLGCHVLSANSSATSSLVVMSTLSMRMPLLMVHTSKPTAAMVPILVSGSLSSWYAGLAILRGAHSPRYAGLSTSGGAHLPLYAGLGFIGRSHLPQPGASSHKGFSIFGGSHSPSSSSSQSSGFSASGSSTISGSSSSHPSGFSASSSTMLFGASSSQSAGFTASGSGIFLSSTQSAGLKSSGSSISAGGMKDGSKSVRRLPASLMSPSMSTSNVLSSLTMSVYRWLFLSCGKGGAFARCFSSISPVFGLLWRKMTCTLSVPPHLSGPNMTVYGVSPLNLETSVMGALKNLRYAPPQSMPSVNAASYCSTNPFDGSNGLSSPFATA
mmetsp:Transcript_14530/g.47735  ORF Transcript_14530/g.47735 Transcript_14530/m.47735 type:complete len:382 (+) Transcript_14530:271-1416(+)